ERDLAEQSPGGLAPADRTQSIAPPLAHWFAGAGKAPLGIQGQSLIWTAHDGHLLYVTGQWFDQIYFRYPLKGEFEFSFDSKGGGRFAAPSPGYAGLVASFGGEAGVHPIFGDDRVNRP